MYWLLTAHSGEIDIIEGVNDQAFNAMTLHTSPGCSITNNGQFSGNIITPSCDVNAPGQPANAGCSIDASSGSNTYGSGLNSIGGGVYATEWTSNHISVYFFPRSSIPSDITSGNPSPSGWGKPLAQFQGGCNIDSTFKNQQIVFDTTFCGDWAGNAWWSSSCSARSSSCTDFVANNPSAFANAYWSINSLKVYQSSGDTAPESSASAGPTGIASGLPSIISSLAPIPVQTTFAVSVKPSSTAASSTTGLAVVPPGVLDPKSSKTSSSKTSSSKTSSSKTSSSKSTSSKHSTTTSHKSSETHHSSSKTSETHHHHHHHSSSKSSTKHHSSTRATVHSVAPVPASSTSPAAHSTSKPAASSSTTLRLLQFSDFPSPSHATSSPNAPPPQATPSIQPLQFGWFPSGGGEGGIPVADTYQTSYKEKRDASPSPDASSSDDNDNLDVEAEMIWRRQRKEQMEQEAESLRKTKKHRRFLGKAHGGGGLKHAHFHH